MRIAPNGRILWYRDSMSWHAEPKLVPGEPGFFYLGFKYEYGVYGQRMDMEGNNYWPTFGDSLVGAQMAYNDTLMVGPFRNFAYKYPYFYGVYSYHEPVNPYQPYDLYVQALDSLGNRVFEGNGVHMSRFDDMPLCEYYYNQIVPDNEGNITAVFEFHQGAVHDIYAKYCTAEGVLGGPDPRRRHEELLPKIDGTSNSRIRFHLPESGLIRIDLYNLLGRKITTIKEGYFNAGTHTVHFDDQPLSSGVYFIKLSTPSAHQTAKIVIVR